MDKLRTLIMTKDAKGSPNGIHVKEYKKGEVYEVPENLAEVFCKTMKCAKNHKRPVIKTPESNQEKTPLETPEG